VNGAYGSILTAFPEQFIDVLYFDMAPLHSSGWGPRTDIVTIEASVVQCSTGRMIKNSNGNLVMGRGIQLWTEEDLVMGRFVDDGTLVYRILKDDSWITEAGFNVYQLSKLVGADDTETVDPAFSLGSFD
jgi:hypothetical protein